MENSSFCQRVIEAASARAGKVAMTLIGPDGAEATAFGEMLSQIRGVAYRLTQEQIAFGDRVALIGENHPHWEIAYLGILYRGAIAVPLDQSAPAGALAHAAIIHPQMNLELDLTSSTWARASISPARL